jgi:hypothetical protein
MELATDTGRDLLDPTKSSGGGRRLRSFRDFWAVSKPE